MIEVSVSRKIDDDHTAAVERAIERMTGDLASPLFLSDLATTGLFSPFHFHRMFRRATTMTPARFLAALRMAKARRLLLHGALTVAAIGCLVGYSSTGTFTTQFTRLVGTSPVRFRELARGLTDQPIKGLLAALDLAAMHPVQPDGLMVVELRRADDAAVQSTWYVAGHSRTMWLDGAPAAGQYEARLFLLDADATPTEALVDGVPGSYLTGDTTLAVSPDGHLSGHSDISLRRPLPIDPPMLSIAPLRWLADVASGAPHAGAQAAPAPTHAAVGRGHCTARCIWR